ncbi:MAG: response regulator, partial [Armatimonadetes bacterium]|nr:response regulator [Armatimonadota bacterium]
GFINVYSEVGQGTVIRIYLPRHAEPRADSAVRRAPEPQRGTETVLLVEDDPAVLKLGVRILTGLGYTVLSAGTPAQALELAATHEEPLHLLITDVVMPAMNGRDLAASLAAARPGLRRLFLSGYPADVIADHGILEQGVQFLAKPFTAHDLSVAVRAALAD